MGKRPRRGKADYFDQPLVELVQGMWQSAAKAQNGRVPLFPKSQNNKLRPGKVRELFGIDENYYSAWKFNDWKKLGIEQPRAFAEALVLAFQGGNYSEDFRKEDVARIDIVHRHWQQFCPSELEQVQQDLATHLDAVRKDFGRPESSQRTDLEGGRRKAELLEVVPISFPLDLSPPPCLDRVLKTDELENASLLIRSHFGIIIQGRPKCGKRYLAQALATSTYGRNRILWFNLASGTTLQHILARLARIDPPLDAPLDRSVAALTEWLVMNDILLVLAGIDKVNTASFAPLLQSLPHISGPAHMIVTSNVRHNGPHVYEVAPLTADEAVNLLTELGVTHNRAEVRSLARAYPLTPFVLRQAAAASGSICSQQIRLGIDRLHSQIVHELAPDLKAVFEILQILATDMDIALTDEVLKALGIDMAPMQILEQLEERLLLRRAGAATWQVETGKTEVATRFIAPDRLRSVLIHLATYFKSRVERGGRIPKTLSDEDWPKLLAACRLLQLADADRTASSAR